VNWGDLEAESQALRDAQDAIERQIDAPTNDHQNAELVRQYWDDVKQHARAVVAVG
jgi:hypothetical protein